MVYDTQFLLFYNTLLTYFFFHFIFSRAGLISTTAIGLYPEKKKEISGTQCNFVMWTHEGRALKWLQNSVIVHVKKHAIF